MKPPLCDPFHAEEFHRLEDKIAGLQLRVGLLNRYLEWALERVEPNEEDEKNMESYHDKWNNAFGLIQEGE